MGAFVLCVHGRVRACVHVCVRACVRARLHAAMYVSLMCLCRQTTAVNDGIIGKNVRRLPADYVNMHHLLELDINQTQRMAQRLFDQLRMRTDYPLGRVSTYDVGDMAPVPPKSPSPVTRSFPTIVSKPPHFIARPNLPRPLPPAQLAARAH